jgi:hypothetical protein
MITIKIPEINFPKIINDKAQRIFDRVLGGKSSLHLVASGIRAEGNWISNLRLSILEIPQVDRISVITKVISILNDFGVQLRTSLVDDKIISEKTLDYIEKILYELYNMLSDYGINVRTDLFSPEEMVSIDFAIREVSIVVNTKKNSDPIIADQMTRIEHSLNELKESAVLGKESFKNKFLGFVLTYSSEKGIDWLFPLLWTKIGSLFIDGHRALEAFMQILISQ